MEGEKLGTESVNISFKKFEDEKNFFKGSIYSMIISNGENTVVRKTNSEGIK